MRELWLVAAILMCASTLCATQGANASMRYVKAGSAPTLAPDQGLLVLEFDTDESLLLVRIGRDGKIFGGDTLEQIPQGRTGYVYVATAGKYRVETIENADMWKWDLRDEKQYQFEVQPGVINYPGDLYFRAKGIDRAIISLLNHGLGVIDQLQASYAELGSKYRFAFTGTYPDPFPEFYRAARESEPAKPNKGPDKTLPVPAPGILPIAVEDLWRASRIQNFSLSPHGDLLVEAIYEKSKLHVDLIDMATFTATQLFESPVKVADLTWVGPHSVAATLGGSDGDSVVYVIRIGEKGTKGRTYTTLKIPRPGKIIDPLPDDPDHLLFESRDDDGSAIVHQLDISGPTVSDSFQFSKSRRLDHGVPKALAWLTDGSGRLRAAVARKDKNPELFYGADGKYSPVFDLEDDTYFDPMAMSSDGRLFYGLSDKDRKQRDLVSLDPDSREIKTIFSKPGIDMEAPVFGVHHALVGAAYRRNGLRVVEYFDQQERTIAERIARAFPDATATVVDRDDGGTQLLLAVEKSDLPDRLYALDLRTGTASLLEESAPWLDDKHLSASRTIHATGSDGTPIEAYLTMPSQATAKVPLIVYTHGGPIGVRDRVRPRSAIVRVPRLRSTAGQFSRFRWLWQRVSRCRTAPLR